MVSRGEQATQVALVLIVAIQVAACAAPPGIHANMLDAELHERLEADFAPGMSVGEAHGRLDALNVSQRDRLLYETDPPQLLARLFAPGGRFLDREDQTIEWVDAWFVFGGDRDTLSRWYTRRGSQRYFYGEPVFAPPREETLEPTRRYPFGPPPPARPPEPQ